MSLATSNRDGGRTNEAGHLRGVTKGFVGQVLEGLAVSQRGAGANMSVDVAIGDAIIQRSDGTYGHPAWNDAVYNQVIAAADGSNPRRDIIVMYIDYGQTPSTGVANNTNGVVKIKSVSGTAAGSPVDPSTATIQSSVGSGNPYVKLARVRIAAGATSVNNSVIDDLRVMATAQPQGGWLHEDTNAWVYGSASTFTVAGVNVTSQFPADARIRVYQSGTVKYFRVVSSSFSTNTTVTLDGGGTYTLTNVPLDKPAYSYERTPSGYPSELLDPSAMSTSIERIIGYWIDGKPIYRKVVNCGAGPNATTKNIAHGVSIDTLVNMYGIAKSSAGAGRSFPVYPTATASTNIIGTLRLAGSDLIWYTTYNASSETGYVVLEYTKP